ncbi:MAG: bacteriohemerythrin [Sideroxydans sp.]|nr:bacteriohemerythrin [Sideroxydans sp.]
MVDRRIYLLAALVTAESFHNYVSLIPDSEPAEWPLAFSLLSNAALFSSFCYITAYAKRLLIRFEMQQRMLERMAFHDRLTGLPNRALFFDRLAQAMSQARRNNSRLALLFLDLDGFKAINDHFGHEAGDELLKATARRLRASIREVDTPARLGGDEFAVILGDLNSHEAATGITEKIISNLSAPVSLKNNHACNIGVSIGIAIYPEHAAEIDSLLTAADCAMYQSKNDGKNTYTLFQKQAQGESGIQPWVELDEAHLMGIPEIDLQHKELVYMLNRLNDAVKGGVPCETLSQMFDELIAYTDFHFRSEERLMEASGYSESEAHKKEHQLQLEESCYLKERLIDGSELLALQSLKDWVLNHILYADRHLAKHLLQHTPRN